MEPRSILLGTTHIEVQRLIQSALEQRHEQFVLTGCAATRSDLLKYCAASPPDFILIDLDMPNTNPAEMVQSLAHHCPAAHIIGLSQSENIHAIRAFLAAGGRGCLLTDELGDDLPLTLNAAFSGQYVFSARVAQRLLTS